VTPEQRQSGLYSLLAAELDLVQQLIALLAQEQDALILRQFDQVSALIDGKTRALQALERASKARAQFCSEHELISIEQIELTLDQQASVWRELLQQAKYAETLNRTNGQLIQTHEEVNQHLMASLAAQRHTDVAYSADGRLSSLSSISRPFDRA
jgi:flagella synthesis protein FlgN